MPAVPEGGHAQFQVWTVKILRQFKAQQVTQTDDRYAGLFVVVFQLTASHSMNDCFFAWTDDMCRAVKAWVK